MEPIVVAIALSLYHFNVAPGTRAQKLYDHFEGNCAELEDLLLTLTLHSGHIATVLGYPTAKVYVQHAMDKYGDEARRRCADEEMYGRA